MGRKIKISILILLLTSITVVGSTMAYFTDEADLATESFVTSELKVEFHQIPTIDAESPYVESQKVTWEIENTGTSDVFLRVRPMVEKLAHILRNIDGEIRMKAHGEKWLEAGDSYYYHPVILGPGDRREFCLAIEFDTWDDIGKFPVDIEVEAAQATNNAIDYLWPDNPFQIDDK